MKKNVIGVDFGTSTSLIRVKEYDGTENDHTLDCKSVTMSQDGKVTAPTLIRVNGEKHTYGHDASQLGKGETYSNFKLLLRSGDAAEREKGVKLLTDFYSFLYKQYASQKSYLFKDEAAEVETFVSYPPQWNEEQKNTVLQAAKAAGFRNVVGMDEASASVNCILNAQRDGLQETGLLQYGEPVCILVIDMGAGTTDLAFVKLTVTEETKSEIAATWPPVNSPYIYGGSQMDKRFASFLKTWLRESNIAGVSTDNLVDGQAYQLKQWKEQTVSAMLDADKAIDECATLEASLSSFGFFPDPMPVLDRSRFEEVFAPELNAFTEVIKSAPAELLGQTDLVILTGGNSAWYWINDILCREDVGLKKIAADPQRIMKMALPNETVARGLIYEPVKLEVGKTQSNISNDFSDQTTRDSSTHKILYSGEIENYGTWEIYDDGLLKLNGHRNLPDWKGKCGNYSPWFIYRDKITSVQIAQGTSAIGDQAFYDCSSLTSITIPNSVTEIGEQAFINCTRLTSIAIPYSVTQIAAWTFHHCSSLTSITIPNSVTEIGDWAFNDCFSLTSITIPDSVTRIGDLAFHKCSSLASITIPDSVTEIGKEAFWLCESLTSITIPDSVTEIGDRAFWECKSLTNITILDSVTEIGDRVFWDCFSLTNITIPDSVTQIGNCAFHGCSSLTNITIPDSVTVIGDGAFDGCSSLTSITIPDSVTEIGEEAFYKCSSLTSITIPDSVTQIGSCAFRGCSSLTSIAIPHSVTEIGTGAFCDCSSLTSITLPNSVTQIGSCAFRGCSSLRSITIPNSVTYIGDSAFKDCSSLRSITIPNSVRRMSADVFKNCPKLKKVRMPSRFNTLFFEFKYGISKDIVDFY